MKTNTRLGLAAVLAALIAAPVAFAQEDAAPGQTMQGDAMKGDMMGGDMSGMMGMMQMMQACTEMMQAMKDHHPAPEATPQGG